MKENVLLGVLGSGLLPLPGQAADVHQRTTITAAATASAIGRARTTVKLNVLERGECGSRSAHVDRPLTAIAPPGAAVVIEVK